MLPQINLKQIGAFRAVMMSGSTSAAAELLNVSQPAVSRLLQSLETQTAYPLFLRQHGKLHPTPEAHAFLAEVEHAYHRLDHLRQAMRNIRLLEGGHLRVIVSTPYSQWLLPQALADFRQAQPDVRVSIEVMRRHDMPKWLEDQKFDVALITLPADYPAARQRRLATLEGVCILPPGHALRGRKAIHARDLANQPFISMVPNTVPRARIDKVFSDLSVPRSAMIETQTGASICTLVAAGLGVSIVDPLTVGDAKDQPFIVKPFRPAIRFDFGLLLPLQRPMSEHAREFVRCVEARMRRFDKGGAVSMARASGGVTASRP
jgi:DNA-binding transcriptional LysR family regulator